MSPPVTVAINNIIENTNICYQHYQEYKEYREKQIALGKPKKAAL